MTTAPSASMIRLRRLAGLPVPLLLFVMAILWFAAPITVYEPPHLIMVLNLLFLLPGALLVAYQAGRAFLLSGNLGLLGFGCGMLFWGSAGPAGGLLVPFGSNAAVTAHNSLIWLAATCQVVGVALAPWQRTVPRWPAPWLTATYAGALTLVVIVVLETLAGGTPPFFIQGEGGTFPRQLVLGSAILMFVATAILLRRSRPAQLSAFWDWYVLALLLIAVGLFGVLIQSSVGGLLGWTGRIAQYLGGVYLLVAAVVGMRETHDLGSSLQIALGEARQRFKELFDLAADGVVLHERISETVPGYFLQANPAICALLGYTAEEMRQLTPLDILAPEDREQIATDGQTIDRDGLLRHEKTLIAKDGRRIPVEISTRQYSNQGQVMVISVIRDVTERKRAEQQLFATNERLKALLDALPVGVAFSEDATCRHVTGNRALLAHFEVSPQDNVSASAPEATAAGHRVRYFQHGRELHADELPLQRAVTENRLIPPMELEVEIPSGRRWLAEVTGAPLRDAKNQVIGGLAVVTDITERQQTEAALRAALDEKEVLLREVYHRVKNNLAAIIDLLELQRESAMDPPTASRLTELRNRIKSMALVHEMLYQSGSLSRVDFHGYLQALAGYLHDSLDPRGAIRLRVTAPEIWMNLDTAIPCGLVVNELVTNAFKYAFPQHRPRPGAGTCEIGITADWDGATYTLAIADNGIGLPDTLDWTTTHTLGLRLVRMLGQHQLGGQLQLDSTGGTRFSLRFGPKARPASTL